jgi:4-carboxymuconolactone decarboxylase
MTHRSILFSAVAFAVVAPAFAAEAPVSPGLAGVAPALQRYTADVLDGDLWKRPGLAPRDRSFATVSAMVAIGQAGALKPELSRALDNGVKPAELGALMTHLAFYAGWPNALSAMGVAKALFSERGLTVAPAADPTARLPMDEKADAPRAAGVEKAYGPVSPAIVRYTNEVLFNDLWRNPDLAPRDRSLVTISALIAGGHAEQLPFHLNRAMDNGMTREEIGETITQLAFYAGWPNALSAVPVAKAVFDKRPK